MANHPIITLQGWFGPHGGHNQDGGTRSGSVILLQSGLLIWNPDKWNQTTPPTPAPYPAFTAEPGSWTLEPVFDFDPKYNIYKLTIDSSPNHVRFFSSLSYVNVPLVFSLLQSMAGTNGKGANVNETERPRLPEPEPKDEAEGEAEAGAMPVTNAVPEEEAP